MLDCTLRADGAALGVDSAGATALTYAQAAWRWSYSAQSPAQANARSVRQSKDRGCADPASSICALALQIQANPHGTDPRHEAIGLTVCDTTPAPAVSVSTRPIITVDTNQQLGHTFFVTDEATATSKAKPKRVMGAEAWGNLGDPMPHYPTKQNDVSGDAQWRYSVDCDGEDCGEGARYRLRWLDGGLQSETASAASGACGFSVRSALGRPFEIGTSRSTR